MTYIRSRNALRRSHAVQLSKQVLIGLAVILGLSIIVISNINSGEKGGRVLLSSGTEKDNNTNPLMINPRYHGVDSKNRPFTVIAQNALQKKDGSAVLEEVNADMLLKEETWLALNAHKGLIDKNGKDIELMGAVNMFYEGGYEFRSEYAKVLSDEGRVYGNQPVEGQGPRGTLRADSFDVTENGQIMNFKKNVHVTLYMD